MPRNVFSVKPERQGLRKHKDIEDGEAGFKEKGAFKEKEKNKKTSRRHAAAA